MNNTPDKPLEAQPRAKLPAKAGKRALPKVIELRYRSFVKELIDSGFNATEAYCRSYKSNDREIGKSCGSQLLANINVAKILTEELVRLDIGCLISKETIVANIYKLLPEAKNEQVKARYLELLAKIGKITDNQPIINAIQVNVSGALDDIIRKRCIKAQSDIVNASIDNTDNGVIDSKPIIDI